jgi:hypothetical protein
MMRRCDPKKKWRHSKGDSVRNEYNELEWADLMRGVEEKDRVVNKIDFLDIFRGQKAVPKSILTTLGVHFAATAKLAVKQVGNLFPHCFQTYFSPIAGITRSFGLRKIFIFK